jgi:hypothetical protein
MSCKLLQTDCFFLAAQAQSEAMARALQGWGRGVSSYRGKLCGGVVITVNGLCTIAASLCGMQMDDLDN